MCTVHTVQYGKTPAKKGTESKYDRRGTYFNIKAHCRYLFHPAFIYCTVYIQCVSSDTYNIKTQNTLQLTFFTLLSRIALCTYSEKQLKCAPLWSKLVILRALHAAECAFDKTRESARMAAGSRNGSEPTLMLLCHLMPRPYISAGEAMGHCAVCPAFHARAPAKAWIRLNIEPRTMKVASESQLLRWGEALQIKFELAPG